MKKIKRVVAPEAAHRYSETLVLATIAMSNPEYSETFACANIAIFLLKKNLLDLKKRKKTVTLGFGRFSRRLFSCRSTPAQCWVKFSPLLVEFVCEAAKSHLITVDWF